jgi:hypothetical protein
MSEFLAFQNLFVKERRFMNGVSCIHVCAKDYHFFCVTENNFYEYNILLELTMDKL